MKPSVTRHNIAKSKLPLKLSVAEQESQARDIAEVASILKATSTPAKSVPAQLLQQLADDRLRHFASFR